MRGCFQLKFEIAPAGFATGSLHLFAHPATETVIRGNTSYNSLPHLDATTIINPRLQLGRHSAPLIAFAAPL